MGSNEDSKLIKIIDFLTYFITITMGYAFFTLLVLYIIATKEQPSIMVFSEIIYKSFNEILYILTPFSLIITIVIYYYRKSQYNVLYGTHIFIKAKLSSHERIELRHILIRLSIILIMFLFIGIVEYLFSNDIYFLMFISIIQYLLMGIISSLVNNYELAGNYFEKYFATYNKKDLERGMTRINDLLNKSISISIIYKLLHIIHNAILYENNGKFEKELRKTIKILKSEDGKQLSKNIMILHELYEKDYEDMRKILTEPKMPFIFKLKGNFVPFVKDVFKEVAPYFVTLLILLFLYQQYGKFPIMP